MHTARAIALSLSVIWVACSGGQSNNITTLGDVFETEIQDNSCTSDDECPNGLCLDQICQNDNEAPFADPGPDMLVATGTLARFFGWNSKDPEGVALTYAWSIEEQPEGSDAQFTADTGLTGAAKLDVIGMYKIALVVNDGFQDSDPAYLNVEVREPDFWINDCFTWPEDDFEQVMRNNIRFEKSLFSWVDSDMGHRQSIQELISVDKSATHNGFFGMGVPYLKWAEFEGLVLTKLELQDSTLTFTPPLVIYPHGVFLDHTLVHRTLGIVKTPSGQITDTVLRARVRAIGKGTLSTTTGNFDDAVHLSIAIETDLEESAPSDVWLAPGLGEARIVHPKPQNHVPQSMVELVWDSNMNTPPPALKMDIPTMTAGRQDDPDFWLNLPPVWHDLAEDTWSPENTTGIDLGAIQMAQDGAQLWVQINVSDPPLSPDTSYSLTISQNQPEGAAGDFTIYVQMQQEMGWHYAINQEADFGSPFSVFVEDPQVIPTDSSLIIALPLSLTGSDSQPKLEEVLESGFIRSSTCLFKESYCSDQLISPIEINLP